MNEITEEEALYDRKLLKDLNFSKFESHFKPPISVTQPGEGLIVRPLQSTDYHAGFIELLGQLTSTGDVSYKEFAERFRSMQNCPNTYFVTVVEDTSVGRVVGSASLVLEQKFIHKCALVNQQEVSIDPKFVLNPFNSLILKDEYYNNHDLNAV